MTDQSGQSFSLVQRKVVRMSYSKMSRFWSRVVQPDDKRYDLEVFRQKVLRRSKRCTKHRFDHQTVLLQTFRLTSLWGAPSPRSLIISLRPLNDLRHFFLDPRKGARLPKKEARTSTGTKLTISRIAPAAIIQWSSESRPIYEIVMTVHVVVHWSHEFHCHWCRK